MAKNVFHRPDARQPARSKREPVVLAAARVLEAWGRSEDAARVRRRRDEEARRRDPEAELYESTADARERWESRRSDAAVEAATRGRDLEVLAHGELARRAAAAEAHASLLVAEKAELAEIHGQLDRLRELLIAAQARERTAEATAAHTKPKRVEELIVQALEKGVKRDAIAAELTQQGHSVSRATVYRVLQKRRLTRSK